MEHNEAVQLQAVVKYVLGELSENERQEFEEHYFDCGACALDLKAAAAFVDTSRGIFQRAGEQSKESESAALRAGWFGWLRPAFPVLVFAALLVVVAYQNVVTIPKAREEAARGSAQVFGTSFSLQMANVRGGEEIKVQVPRNESFGLQFDFTPSRKFASYIGQLQDVGGRSLLQVSIPGSLTNKEAQLVVPAGLLQPGKYLLVFTGDPGSKGQIGKEVVLRFGFAVEFLP